MSTRNFVEILHDPEVRFAPLVKRIRTSTAPHFLLCAAGSELSDREGISAAGLSAQDRRLTPAIDAEALLKGRPISADSLPVSPRGIVSPVVLTRSSLRLAGITAAIVDCGCFVPPAVDHVSFSEGYGRCPSTGRAMDLNSVQRLFDAGVQTGRDLLNTRDALVIAECVPGGTTTALGILLALGHKVEGLVSSSLPIVNHSERQRLIFEGLKNAGSEPGYYRAVPLASVAAVGDPMQAFVAGAVLAASPKIPVIMGGGAQMLAVYALIKALIDCNYYQGGIESVAVATTKWVAFDRGAGSQSLAQLIGAPFVAACPDFYQSRHAGLKAYEEGNVKEGVGAGASMAVANIRGSDDSTIVRAIDSCYDEMVLGKIANLS
ncbi:MAG: TIGR00303 family protein [Candidatus Obscuribacterales bacterium]|nr:TIGR00303 family protein [Candidatus Obscuribacterales bacterium]